jgi:hypothetical protein
MVDDPPAFAYFSRRPTIIRPLNGRDAVLSAARRYGARYWVAPPGAPGPAPAWGRGTGVRLVARLSGTMVVYAFTAE